MVLPFTGTRGIFSHVGVPFGVRCKEELREARVLASKENRTNVARIGVSIPRVIVSEAGVSVRMLMGKSSR